MQIKSGFKRDNFADILDSGTGFATDSRSKADLLNSFFAKQCCIHDCDRSPPSSDQLFPPGHFRFDCIQELDARNQLLRLDTSKSCGLDGIGNALLRATATSIAKPLAMIFNASLQNGQFPSAWKAAVVVPVPKGKGDRCAVSSYRPISLTVSLSKVLERLAHQQILTYLLDNDSNLQAAVWISSRVVYPP